MSNEIQSKLSLDAKIEALLFFKGEPISMREIAKYLKVIEGAVKESLEVLGEKLGGRGLSLVHKDNKVMLGTNKEMGPLLESMRKEELQKELSKASLETLSIVLYKDGITRSEIDYIRGVNSSFILRSLLIRGLVERKTHTTDSRKYIYKPTFELLSFLGLSKIADLPEYTEVVKSLSEGIEDTGEKDIDGEDS